MTESFLSRTSKGRIRRSQWPKDLRRGSAADRLLGMRVRIPPGAWMFVLCVLYIKDKRQSQGNQDTRVQIKYREEKNLVKNLARSLRSIYTFLPPPTPWSSKLSIIFIFLTKNLYAFIRSINHKAPRYAILSILQAITPTSDQIFIFLGILISKVLTHYFLLDEKYHVSYSYTTRVRVMILHILILIFPDSRRECKGFWIER